MARTSVVFNVPAVGQQTLLIGGVSTALPYTVPAGRRLVIKGNINVVFQSGNWQINTPSSSSQPITTWVFAPGMSVTVLNVQNVYGSGFIEDDV